MSFVRPYNSTLNFIFNVNHCCPINFKLYFSIEAVCFMIADNAIYNTAQSTTYPLASAVSLSMERMHAKHSAAATRIISGVVISEFLRP